MPIEFRPHRKIRELDVLSLKEHLHNEAKRIREEHSYPFTLNIHNVEKSLPTYGELAERIYRFRLEDNPFINEQNRAEASKDIDYLLHLYFGLEGKRLSFQRTNSYEPALEHAHRVGLMESIVIKLSELMNSHDLLKRVPVDAEERKSPIIIEDFKREKKIIRWPELDKDLFEKTIIETYVKKYRVYKEINSRIKLISELYYGLVNKYARYIRPESRTEFIKWICEEIAQDVFENSYIDEDIKDKNASLYYWTIHRIVSLLDKFRERFGESFLYDMMDGIYRNKAYNYDHAKLFERIELSMKFFSQFPLSLDSRIDKRRMSEVLDFLGDHFYTHFMIYDVWGLEYLAKVVGPDMEKYYMPLIICEKFEVMRSGISTGSITPGRNVLDGEHRRTEKQIGKENALKFVEGYLDKVETIYQRYKGDQNTMYSEYLKMRRSYNFTRNR